MARLKFGNRTWKSVVRMMVIKRRYLGFEKIELVNALKKLARKFGDGKVLELRKTKEREVDHAEG